MKTMPRHAVGVGERAREIATLQQELLQKCTHQIFIIHN